MDVALLLADAAQVADGKLNILGGGWSVVGFPMGPTAIAIKADVPWDQANIRHRFLLKLEQTDGPPVLMPRPPQGEMAPLEIPGEFEVGRPPGMTAGASIPWVVAFTIAPLPLNPGRYQWALTIGDQTWVAAFTVVSQVRGGPTG